MGQGRLESAGTPSGRAPAGRGAAPFTLATRLLLLGYLALILLTFLHYGITYDEAWNSKYGSLVLRWYASGFSDRSALTYWTLPYEGSFFNALAHLAARVLPLGIVETQHLTGALFGLLAAVFASRLAARLGGPAAGFFAALFLITTPLFYGHAFANPRDIPMAGLVITALFYLIRILDHLPRPPKSLLLRLGVVTGLCLAVRFGSVILLGTTGLAFLLGLIRRRRRGPADGAALPSIGSDIRSLALAFIIVLAAAWAAMLPWWPKAQVEPLWPIESFIYTTQEFGYDIQVLFDGKVLSNQDLPWYYVLKCMALVTPEHFVLALAVGLALLLAAAFRYRRRPDPVPAAPGSPSLGILVTGILAALPVAYATVRGAIVYDGIRHFLFVYPPLAVLAGVSVARALAGWRRPWARGLLLLAVVGGATTTVADMVRLHPYEYIFFNRSVAGGLPGASGGYDTEYWGGSYKEGAEWVVANYHRTFPGRRVRVASCSYSLSTSHYLPEDTFEYLGSFDNGQQISPASPRPDLFLSITRWDGHKKLPGRVIHTVARMGVPLLQVIEVPPE